jgi:hypothetical protein
MLVMSSREEARGAVVVVVAVVVKHRHLAEN